MLEYLKFIMNIPYKDSDSHSIDPDDDYFERIDGKTILNKLEDDSYKKIIVNRDIIFSNEQNCGTNLLNLLFYINITNKKAQFINYNYLLYIHHNFRRNKNIFTELRNCDKSNKDKFYLIFDKSKYLFDDAEEQIEDYNYYLKQVFNSPHNLEYFHYLRKFLFFNYKNIDNILKIYSKVPDDSPIVVMQFDEAYDDDDLRFSDLIFKKFIIYCNKYMI